MECWILALPLFIIFLFVVAFALVCFKRWRGTIVVLGLSLICNWYGETFALHPFSSCSSPTEENEVKVMTFNVHGPGESFDLRLNGISEIVKKENPDVLFISEMFTPCKHYDVKLDSLLRARFPYSTYEGKTQWGNVFYSKFPIDTVEIIGISIGKSQPLATIDVNGRKFSFMGCHLSSNNYVDSKTKLEVDSISSKVEAKQYFQTIEKGYRSRRQDIDSISLHLADRDKRNLIVLGDMNDVGGSYTIRTLKSFGLQDAWWKGGCGFGGTRKVLGFPFRIDHILYGEGFELKDVRVIETNGLSDHNAMVASFGM